MFQVNQNLFSSSQPAQAPSYAQVVTGRQQDLFSNQHSRMVNNKQQQ